jgi:hypothetical protein
MNGIRAGAVAAALMAQSLACTESDLMNKGSKQYKTCEPQVGPLEVTAGTVMRIDIEHLAEFKRLLDSLEYGRVVYQRVSAGRLLIVEDGQ